MSTVEKLDKMVSELVGVAVDVGAIGGKHNAKIANSIRHLAKVLGNKRPNIERSERYAAKRAAAAEKRTGKAVGKREKLEARLAKLRAELETLGASE